MVTVNFQEQFYRAGVNYRKGSPHLGQWVLYDRLVEVLRGVAVRLDEQGLPLQVLEVGAGHGGFTEPALALGCDVTAVEMSRPSIEELRRRFGINPKLRFIYDPEGDLSDAGEDYTLLMCVSVLHHIPDYMAFLENATKRLAPGGAFLTLQDPTWYPRHPAAYRAARATYFAWRLGQGNLVDGVRTRFRRMRGVFDEANPADMVEYHLVRNGIDENAVLSFLGDRFAEVTYIPYWSSQLGLAHGLAERLGLQSTFGVVALGYHGG